MPASIRSFSKAVDTVDPIVTLQLPSHLDGDHVYVLAMVYAQLGNTTGNCGPIPAPDGYATTSVEIVETTTVVGQIAFFYRKVEGAPLGTFEFTNPCVASGFQAFAIAFVVRDVGGEAGLDLQLIGPFNTNDQFVPPVTIPADDTVVGLVMASIGWFDQGDPPSPGFPYEIAKKQTLGYVQNGAEARVWLTDPRDDDIPAVATKTKTPTLLLPNAGLGWYIIATITAVPLGPPAAAPGAILRRLRLGCADDYRCKILGSDYETVISSIGWRDLEWSRVLDEPSSASVSVPDELGGVSCCASTGGLVPWRFGLQIERNDQLVWKGPVTSIQREPGGVRLTASDVLARFQKRLAIRESTVTFQEADAGVAFAALVLLAQIPGENWDLQPPEAIIQRPFTRTVSVAGFEMSWDILSELADAAVDFWVGNGVLYVYEPGTGWLYWDGFGSALLDGPYAANGDLVYGVFSEKTFVAMPTWAISGWTQANTGWIPGPDVGEDGARAFWAAAEAVSVSLDGVLDWVETGNLYQPAAGEEVIDPFLDLVMQHHADTMVAQRATAPAVMEGGELAEGAPVDVANLRPGSIWLIDVWDQCYGQLLQRTRLKSVTVKATKNESGAVTESVLPTLYPVGYEVE